MLPATVRLPATKTSEREVSCRDLRFPARVTSDYETLGLPVRSPAIVTSDKEASGLPAIAAPDAKVAIPATNTSDSDVSARTRRAMVSTDAEKEAAPFTSRVPATKTSDSEVSVATDSAPATVTSESETSGLPTIVAPDAKVIAPATNTSDREVSRRY